MEIKDMLQGLTTAISGLGLEVVKITTADEKTIVEAVNSERTVILKGEVQGTVNNLPNGVFGLSNLGLLTGILNLSTYNDETATTEVLSKKDVITEFLFKCGGSKTNYRVMGEKSITKQPNFKEPEWDVEVKPTKAKVAEFDSHSTVFGSVSKMFKPYIEEGNLKFAFGDMAASNHSSSVSFEEVQTPELKGGYSYPIDKFLKALKHTASADVTLKFSSKGVAQIDVDTGLFNLKFILPGHGA